MFPGVDSGKPWVRLRCIAVPVAGTCPLTGHLVSENGTGAALLAHNERVNSALSPVIRLV
jgi:hypothetical protein